MNAEIVSRFQEIRSIHYKNILTKPIKDYGGYEIISCIHEKVLLEYVIPIISRYLEVRPLTAGGTFKGEVLANILELDNGFWNNHIEWYLYFKRLAIKTVKEYGISYLMNELEPHIFKVYEKESIEPI